MISKGRATDKIKERLVDKLKELIYDQLKEEAVKIAIRKLIVTSSLGQFALKYLIEELMDDYGLPMFHSALREIGYQVNKIEGSLVILKLERAHESDDQSAYDGAIDDIHKL